MSCGLCADDCGRWLKDMRGRLDAARISNTLHAGRQDVERAGSPCTRPVRQTDVGARVQHSAAACGNPADARPGLDSQARCSAAVRWNSTTVRKAD
ncbi:UNVERIFIED_CONTAM: hypothetical protein Slati_3912400 [Sesamum latifolium]|uniref:Uncharacterized protein n=1 Tax=Sesamum latifolium TaxID=2727402 RepID=A0AAW2TLX5_9LAMI